MNGYETSDENRPVTWVRGYPIYASHFVVLVLVVSMIVTALLRFGRADELLGWLMFNSERVRAGEVWRIFSYGLVNQPGIFFAIDMLMIVWFGREVEKLFGWRKFLLLYGGVYLLLPLLFTAISPWMPSAFAGEMAGFSIFIAFATIYPNVGILFTLLAKWVAAILVGLYTLIALADHSWVLLISLWAGTGFAYGFVRLQQGQWTLPSLRLRRSRPSLRVLPDLPAKIRTGVAPTPESPAMAEIDALLDKIAVSGISSLTAKERAKLDSSRRDLLKKKSGRP
jgi:hypothetical protein